MAEAITTAREAGCDGTLIVRGDSAYYSGAVVAACRRAGARFSFIVTMDPKISRTIAAIDEEAFTPIRYPRAIFDEASGQWISDAQVAEVGYTAFAAKAKHRVTARLIVRRVKDLAVDQDELFPVWRYHAVFTDNPHELVTAEGEHRDHAIIEQVFADLYDGPLAHLPPPGTSPPTPPGSPWPRSPTICSAPLAPWPRCFMPTPAAPPYRQLITVPARLARRGRGHITLHLPDQWPWQDAWTGLFDATHRAPPVPAA